MLEYKPAGKMMSKLNTEKKSFSAQKKSTKIASNTGQIAFNESSGNLRVAPVKESGSSFEQPDTNVLKRAISPKTVTKKNIKTPAANLRKS